MARKQLKPRLMATYYDKLTKIFHVSGNHLFHAYAWHKYYMLTRYVSHPPTHPPTHRESSTSFKPPSSPPPIHL